MHGVPSSYPTDAVTMPAGVTAIDVALGKEEMSLTSSDSVRL